MPYALACGFFMESYIRKHGRDGADEIISDSIVDEVSVR